MVGYLSQSSLHPHPNQALPVRHTIHRSDYTAARRLQQQIPLPIADVLTLLKQHGNPQAAIAAYRADQIAHIRQATVCSEAEAAHQYDVHQGNTERAIATICRTPVYLGQHTIDGEKWGYAITPLNSSGGRAQCLYPAPQFRSAQTRAATVFVPTRRFG